VLPLLVGTVVGLVALWPRGATPIGSMPLTVEGVTIETSVVVESGERADGSPRVVAELETGPGAGDVVEVQLPTGLAADVGPGDRLKVSSPGADAVDDATYTFWDFDRRAPMAWLAVGYLLAVALVARLRGMAAVAGLAASLSVIVYFVLPAIILGSSPLLVALVGSSAMMFLAVYLAHGISIRTTTALLGTFAGLAITVLLAAWGTRAANLTGSGDGVPIILESFPDLRVSDLVLAGIVIAGLGALNDVTITQASAVWELHSADPRTPRVELFRRGMRIGRDHIASTVYTLAFAYVGTALPLLIVASLWQRPAADTVTSGDIAEEVVRTLVSSIGLVLAIPITTAIAASLVKRRRRRPWAPGQPCAAGASGRAPTVARAARVIASTGTEPSASRRAWASSSSLSRIQVAQSRTCGRARWTARRSRSVRPPQTPYWTCASSASTRHAMRAGHRWQSDRSSRCAAPRVNSRSGSEPAHRAPSLSSELCMQTPWCRQR
jgi:uncharacterized membrane protein